jgi:predicted Zn-dependent protease
MHIIIMIKERFKKLSGKRDMDFLPNHPYNNNRFDRVKEKARTQVFVLI